MTVYIDVLLWVSSSRSCNLKLFLIILFFFAYLALPKSRKHFTTTDLAENNIKFYVYSLQQAFPKTFAEGTKFGASAKNKEQWDGVPPHFSPIFCSPQVCSFARPLFRSLVRSPPGKGKETAATQATSRVQLCFNVWIDKKIRDVFRLSAS